MISQPLTLPCGHSVFNRRCKAAMTEGLAYVHDRATWARGGAAIQMTGNVMVDDSQAATEVDWGRAGRSVFCVTGFSLSESAAFADSWPNASS